jgi:hypothetical protein
VTYSAEDKELPIADVSEGSGLMDKQQGQDSEGSEEQEDDGWSSAPC